MTVIATAPAVPRYPLPQEPIYVADKTTLRAINTNSLVAFITGHFSDPSTWIDSGWWLRDDNDTTSADDNYTCIISVVTNKRWKPILPQFNSERIFNVLRFGVRAGAGVSGNTAKINYAIEAAGEAGGVVYFPPTDALYNIDMAEGSILLQYSGVRMRGAGWGSRIHFINWRTDLNAATIPFCFANIVARKSGGVLYDTWIEDLHFSGIYNYAVDHSWYLAGGGTFPWGVIQFTGQFANEVSYNSGVRRCIFRNTGGSCMGAGGGTNVPDIDSGVTNHHNLVFASNDVDNTIFSAIDVFSGGIEDGMYIQNKIRRCSGGGILMPGHGAIIQNNDISYTMNYAISVSGFAAKERWTKVLDNHMSYVGKGVLGSTTRSPAMYFGDSVAQDNKIEVGRNTMVNVYGGGIWCNGGAAQDMDIHHNTVDGFGYQSTGSAHAAPADFIGIAAINGTRVRVQYNHVKGLGGAPHKSNSAYSFGGGLASECVFNHNTLEGTFVVSDASVNFSGGSNAAGTNNYTGLNNYNITTGKQIALLDSANNPSLPIAADLDATPSVKNIPSGGSLLLNNTVLTLITNLDDGYDGQVIKLLGNNANGQINNGGNFQLAGGNWVSASNNAITLERIFGGVWRELSRS